MNSSPSKTHSVLTELAEQPAALGKRERTKRRNRRIILHAAKEVFASIGFENATVRDIIHATPLASGTFYNYFKSKDDIYRAIYEEAAHTIRPELRAARRGATTAEAFVRDSTQLYFAYILREWKGFYALRCAPNSMRVRFEAAEVIAAYEELREDITEAVRKGIFPDTNITYLTATLIGIGQEVAGELLRQPDGDAQEAADFVTRFTLAGIKSFTTPAKTSG